MPRLPGHSERALRLGIGSFMQESNSFSPVATRARDFSPVFAADAGVARAGTRTEMGAFLDVAQAAGVEAVPLFSGAAVTAGPVLGPDYRQMRSRLLDAVAAAGPLDGLLLALHGAMCAEGVDDCEGDVLQAIRAAIGPRVPLAVTLDLHANVTAMMVRHSDIVVGYRTYPHIDMYETGEAVTHLLLRTLRGEIDPVAVMLKVPMIVPAENMQTTHGPMAEVWKCAGGSRVGHPEILSASVFAVQPWLDIDEMGAAVVAVADRRRESAEQCVRLTAAELWRRRREFDVRLLPPGEAVSAALAHPGAPVVLADSADSPTAGAPGDSVDLLATLLEIRRDCPAAFWVRDPEFVSRAWQVDPGSRFRAALGGRLDPANRRSVSAEFTVLTRSDGRFVFKGAWARGVEVNMGRTVVVQTGGSVVVVSEEPAAMIDPELYRSQGVALEDKKIIGVKSANAFRHEYSAFAAAILLVDTPGAASANLRALPFRRVTRPVYPLDEPEFDAARAPVVW